MRKREDEDLARLKAKQAKRKVIRAEEEKKLKQQKKEEEERRAKEEAEIKQKEETEKKRQEQAKSNKEKRKLEGDQSSSISAARGEKGKTKEQLAEEKKIALMVRVAPLSGLDNMGLSDLKAKADDLWKKILRLETEKYDMEQRRARQDYDLKELKTRQAVKLRQQALKQGLDAEALTGKHPPKIQVSSKFERRADSRSYDDKKNLFEGGYEVELKNHSEQVWKEKYDDFLQRNKSKLPKWFGERPGAKGGNDYDSDDEDEDEDDEYNGRDDDDDAEETEDEESKKEEEEDEEEDEESEEEEDDDSGSGEEEEEE